MRVIWRFLHPTLNLYSYFFYLYQNELFFHYSLIRRSKFLTCSCILHYKSELTSSFLYHTSFFYFNLKLWTEFESCIYQNYLNDFANVKEFHSYLLYPITINEVQRVKKSYFKSRFRDTVSFLFMVTYAITFIKRGIFHL